jgi:hypothetical protein
MTDTTHPLLRAVRGLDLAANDYVIFGSAPMWIHGLRTQLSDLDVVARNAAWHDLATFYPPRPAPSGHGQVIRLVIEVVDRWLPGWDTNHLIAGAQDHHGLPFASLAQVRASKTQTLRSKDLYDLTLIDTATAAAEGSQ